MRVQILQLLKKNLNKYISGEAIANELNVSRTAIWKHINHLKKTGYNIESTAKAGYKLTNSLDLLSKEEIFPYISNLENINDILYYDSLDSTNNKAKILANKGAKSGTIVIAEEQTGGRGRLNRSFYSPKYEGILFSLILRPNFLPTEASKMTLLAAVSVVLAIEKITGIKLGIKWPNDILYENKKLVGILTELNGEMDRINYIVLGIGINVNLRMENVPKDIKNTLTSLNLITKNKIDRKQLFIKIIEEFDILYKEVEAKGFAHILDLWREYSITLNKEIKVIAPNEEYIGKAIDIDEDGALIVNCNGKIKKVIAGDVSIRNK